MLMKLMLKLNHKESGKKERKRGNQKKKKSIKNYGCNSLGFGGLLGLAPCRK